MMQSYTKFLAFFQCCCFRMYVCARDRSKNLQSKKIDRVEIAPLDHYGLENLTTVTKINLRAHYVCVLIMSDPWLSCRHEETRVLATQSITQSHVVQMTNIGRMDL